jgi:glucokinase
VTDKKIGIAMPGPFDYEVGIALMKGQDKFDDLYGSNVKEMLAVSLDIDAANILLVNDAECFLRGEVFSGAAKDFNKSIGLTLGTGLGSSICDRGIIRDADLWCSLFKDGIAEDYLSTRWFIKQYKMLTGEQATDVKDIVERSASNPAVKQIFQEFGKNLALFLNDFIWKNKPEVVVIGGNIAKAWELFSASMNQHLLTTPAMAVIRKAVLGEEAQLIGAASCWYKNEPRILAA